MITIGVQHTWSENGGDCSTDAVTVNMVEQAEVRVKFGEICLQISVVEMALSVYRIR